MRTIWKFPLKVTDQQGILVPKGAVPLRVDRIDTSHFRGEVFMWMEIDPEEEEKVFQLVTIHGTGHNLAEDRGRYLNTFFIDNLVFHVYVGRQS